MHKYKQYSDSFVMPICIGVLMLISPIIGFFLSIFCFRQKSALLLFILFSFYFGWFYEPQLDLLNHYNSFLRVIGVSPFKIWFDSDVVYSDHEPYPVLFKYFIGEISSSKNLFSACACSIYTIIFVYGVLGSIRDLYIKRMTPIAWVIFLGIIFIVEYNWFLGLRFWSGVFVFISFYIRYVRTEKLKYIWLSCLCVAFHFSLIALCVAAFINYLLKDNFKIRYIILGVSFFIRIIKLPLAIITAKLDIMKGFVTNASRDDQIIKSVAKRMEYFRTEGNQFYMLRNDILLLGALILIYYLYKYENKYFYKSNSQLWGMFLMLFAISNFGYMDLTLYDRFFKATILLLYIFLYLYVSKDGFKIGQQGQILMSTICAVPVLYAFLTMVVSQREYLWNIELWFNNFLWFNN